MKSAADALVASGHNITERESISYIAWDWTKV